MRAMRRTAASITIAALAAAGLGATPARAADHNAPVRAKFGVERVVGWAKRTHERQHHRAEVRGPVFPLIGDYDYGTGADAFGAPRDGHIHAGQDLLADPGTPEVAVTDGIIDEASSDGSEGNYVYLYDPKRDRTYVYMHMIEPAKVHAGEQVKAGQLLGAVGCTGSCEGDHLHFEVRDGRGYAGAAHDPLPLLKDWKQIDQPR